MTRGKLLDNDTQLFIFISILIMTQLHPKGPRKQTTEPILGTALLEKKNPSYNWLNGKLGIIGEKCRVVTVDLIGEKNQVILE